MAQDEQTGISAPITEAPEAAAEPQAPSIEDRVKNLHAETSRKMKNLEENFASQNQKLESIYQTILERMQGQAQPQATQASPSLKDLVLDDPDRAAQIIEERAVRRAESVVNQQVQASQATQNVVFDMQSKYPEFGQAGSEAGRMAIEKAAKLPPNMRGTPEGARMAMLEVVSELGLLPVSKRTKPASTQSEDFAIAGSTGEGQRRAPVKKNSDINPDTLAFAQLLNPNVTSDPKLMEELKKASQRDKFNKWR